VNSGEKILEGQMTQKIAILLCLLLISFAAAAQSQDQSSSVPPAETNTANTKPKAKPNAEPKTDEAEAGTSGSTEALQKATQNPVASLISVPVQNNLNFGVNPGYRNQNVLNIQPVIPMSISTNWNLLVRWIVPIVYQPIPNASGTPETGVSGLGDMVPTFSFHRRSPES
jgi:hypothetical protein